jgi:DNA repair exonuclease SbcCD ATPase subunit
MALTDRKARRGGWQHQAERLALTHTAVIATAAEQARHRAASNPVSCHLRTHGTEFQGGFEASTTELAHEPDLPRPRFVGLEQHAARETTAAWLPNGRRETLAARAARTATAEKRATELEDELALARERLALQENENQSLQMSLDLTTSENSHISTQLAECERQIEVLEQLHAKLTEDTNTLLKTCMRRDAALARAEERLSLLADLFIQLEAASQPARKKAVEKLNIRLQRELENDKWLLAETETFIKRAV